MTFERAMALLGVAVGSLLLASSIYMYGIGIDLWRLSFCIGFGIILGSFGTVANVNTKIWTITGAGAIAIVLFLVTKPDRNYVVGLITGEFPEGTRAFVRDVQDVPGGFMEMGNKYRMVLLGSHLESPFLEVEVKLPKDHVPILVQVPREHINALIARGQNFFWTLREQKLFDAEGNPVPTVGRARNSLPVSWDGLHLIGQAWALEATPEMLGAFSAKLASEDYRVRRDNRNSLVSVGVPAIRPVVDALSKHDPLTNEAFDYYYVLATIQRNNERNSRAIQGVLNPEDFPLLIKGIANPKKEVRLLATEFLYGIADKRALRPSLDLLKQTTDQDAQWNAILVIESFYGNLAAAEKESAARELKSANVGEKTRAKINSFL